jgi:choline dehydrogenase
MLTSLSLMLIQVCKARRHMLKDNDNESASIRTTTFLLFISQHTTSSRRNSHLYCRFLAKNNMFLIELFIGAICLTCCTSIVTSLEYDFIVVGVGSGGSIMAARLSEPDHNWTVLALDRGTAPDPTRKDKWGSDPSKLNDPSLFSVPQDYLLGRLVRNPRYYGIGGTAMINGMVSFAPSRYLLDQLWPSGWKWDDLFPYMIKMQNHYCYYLPSSLTGISDADCRKWHGRDGPLDISPSQLESLPYTVLDLVQECNETIGFMPDPDNPTKQYGCYFPQLFCKPLNKSDPNSPCKRASTWAAYLNGTKRSNLQILDSATVLRLIFDENEPTKCVGVTYEYREQIYTAIARKEVILSAGVFDTPKPLQLSGVGPKEWLEPLGVKIVAENSEVGENLVDHMGVFVAFETIEGLPQPPWDYSNCRRILNSGLKESNKNWTDMLIYCSSNSAAVTLDNPIVGNDPVLAYSQPPIPYILFTIVHSFPDASGTVKIQSLSPYDRPRIDHGWHNLSDYDRNSLQYGVDTVRNMTKNTRWGQKYIKQELYPGNRYGGSDDLHRRLDLVSYYHQVGTCGLGKCTDNEARVLGIKSVRICDMSLFPTQLNLNPTYTLYSMCEKLADLIKKQYSHD